MFAETVVLKKRLMEANKASVYLTGPALDVASIILEETNNVSNVTLLPLPSPATIVAIIITIILQKLVIGSVHVESSSSLHALLVEVVEIKDLEETIITTRISLTTTRIQIIMEIISTTNLKIWNQETGCALVESTYLELKMHAESVEPPNLNPPLTFPHKVDKTFNVVEPWAQDQGTGLAPVDLWILLLDRSAILARRKNLPSQSLEYNRLD